MSHNCTGALAGNLRKLGDSGLLSLLLYIPGSLHVTCDICLVDLRCPHFPVDILQGRQSTVLHIVFVVLPVKPKVTQLIKCSKFKKLPRMHHRLFKRAERVI